ncbi:Hypothetical_protein [Hexamita inflata]|uniref:Hypothetical_protein n=1 Tax=Hexamita inflata TaxID=28002 RepID=A0AA86N8T4_9EUKA|nr:Hypothetical protein HINF_LOCUS2483 [Hexamita inflata]CAI9929173.1 Hypothetical protein HINF_LOCUS16818 [Hexamita inflata]CAI9933616.1 Hypothetical protein HINF_LOCUS21261 [Hexamita inflata]CAI9933625.1 Hypothetical protein HINF_LOCUS21270 [Hexamita inflata]CAI9959973.1 Hypothetical protein HINF_LOCUS47618 [Hexamita inflata]
MGEIFLTCVSRFGPAISGREKTWQGKVCPIAFRGGAVIFLVGKCFGIKGGSFGRGPRFKLGEFIGRIFLWVRCWDFHGGRRLLGVSAVLFVALSLGEVLRESKREQVREQGGCSSSQKRAGELRTEALGETRPGEHARRPCWGVWRILPEKFCLAWEQFA